VPLQKCACGHELEIASPLESTGTAADARPEPGSVTLCIECGRCYQFNSRLEIGRPIDAARLPGIDSEQLRAIRRAQDLIRDMAAKRLFDRSLSPGYIACCERAEELARRWIQCAVKKERRRRPRSILPRPKLRLPDPAILLVAPLETLAARIAGNRTARDLLAHLSVREPDLTVFMLRVVAARLALDVETVPLSALGLSVGQS